ncbi:MAG TPA: translation initiation factor IF-2 [Gemmatimonadales bacterium]|nr:translation initiation factor IF-2 [Gemmatimonadales bacterium]
MVKTRVHELAAEFGVPPEQLLGMLKEMNIFVRSHMSPLEGEQVAAVRVRWEREKRKAHEEEKPRKTRKKAAAVEPAPAPVSAEAKPAKRRRTAAEVAKVEAQQAAEREAEEKERALLELERPAPLEPVEPISSATIEERARQLFKDLPPAEPAEAEETEAPSVGLSPLFRAPPAAPPAEPAAPGVFEPPAPPAAAAAASAAPAGRQPFIPPRIQRPPAVKPGASSAPGRSGPGDAGRGPKPVFSSSYTPDRPAGGPPRPGAPAATGTTEAERGGAGGRPGKKGKKGRRSSVDQDAVQANIEKTLAGLKGGVSRKSRRSDEPSYRDRVAGQLAAEKERERTLVRVNEFISVSELAALMKIPATQIVQFAFKELGLMVTVNQRLDFDQIELIASEFGFQALREQEYAAEDERPAEEDKPEDLSSRPPVVTIMGHVDHGKTSLLDFVRKANVVAGEAGGITQHIGAYNVGLPDGRSITFLDTPGHQAFTAMRARGAQVTDIVVLVVAADDQVMPQTVEAISHAKNAGVPMIVAINKIDLPAANVPKVKQDLLQHSVVLEEFGGNTLHAEISAKKGTGIDGLLEQVLLQAEILDLKANAATRPHATVLEATLDPGKGPLATVLVQRGTLRVGDNFICGRFSGRVRALFDERGRPVKEAGPSMPVQVLGFEGVPAAGDAFISVADAVEARDIAQKRQRLEREAQSRRSQKATSLEDFSRQLKEGAVSQLRIIIKADQGGPAEALADALAQLSTPEVRVDVVHRGVGAITESDVLLAKASGAIILGFHVRPDSNARNAAERESVDVRTYRIIYEAVEDVRNALEGLLKPEEKETVLGEAEVLQLFKVSKVGTIAGCMVRHGTIQRTNKARVMRDGVTVYTGSLSSLKRFKDDVKEVREGLECGIGIENYNDLKVGDRIESFRVEEVRRTLQASAETGAA